MCQSVTKLVHAYSKTGLVMLELELKAGCLVLRIMDLIDTQVLCDCEANTCFLKVVEVFFDGDEENTVICINLSKLFLNVWSP